MNPMAGKTLSVAGTARGSGCTLKYIYDLVYAGKLDAIKINGKWHISVESVKAWRNGRRRQGEARDAMSV